MAIPQDQIVDVTPSRFNRAEALFVPAIFKGLGTTMRHLFGNVGRDGKNKKNIWVVQYPEEKRDDRPVVEGGVDVLVVGLAVLAFDGKDGHFQGSDEGSGHVVLCRQRVGGTQPQVGAPRLENAAVVGTVVEQGRDRKIRVFKHKRRKHYRRTRGHRQSYTAVKIERVEA